MAKFRELGGFEIWMSKLWRDRRQFWKQPSALEFKIQTSLKTYNEGKRSDEHYLFQQQRKLCEKVVFAVKIHLFDSFFYSTA
jgi:hypothetical protein